MIDYESILNKLPDGLKKQVRCQQNLSDLTTLKIGGPAHLCCDAGNTDQARRFQEIAHNNNLPFFILGGGSNILAADEGFSGLVLVVKTEQFQPHGNTLIAGAGLNFDTLIERSLKADLTGLEFASGIPGTLGGAIMGNAGCYGHEIGEFLLEATTLDSEGVIHRRGPEDFGFGYRQTALREKGEVLLEATLNLEKGSVSDALQARQTKIDDRWRKHPRDLPSAGSWFRNLPATHPGERRIAAGTLLEKAGAKEMTEGDAGVFHAHANMIVNNGNATCAQVRQLARRMKEAVLKNFQVELIQEVRHLQNPDEMNPK
ncbi:MAG: UDP-N-acetylmuramate dehydrogenase [bacterium]|nr:UDP-N-acetylmuramate dehydrogenase [bacterium]